MAHITSFDKLLEAMSKIADSSDSKLKYDKTVIMEIVQLVDATTGEYAVKYQGNTIQAFAADLNAKYNKGDSVYVKIPEGDFTNTKIIEGKVSNKDTTEQERNIISNTIIDIEPSWFAESTYGVLPKVDGLSSGGEVIDEKENPQEILIWQHNDENAQHTGTDTLLKTYNKEFDKFIIKASFMTNFLGNHIQGNYGLKLTLRLVNVNKEKENDPEYITKDFILDTTSFTGNVYELSSYSPQYAVFQIPKNSFMGVESFTFFQENMEIDVWTKPDPSNPTSTTKQNISTPNIYVKDISVNYVQILDYTQDTYYVLIDTPKGNTLGGNVSEITANPRLIYKGENVISDSSCEVYWYKENPDALVGTPLYSAQVGCGWELINDEAKVSKNILTISKNDVIIEQRYKVLILYGKKQSPFTGIVTVYNSEATSNVVLLRDTVKDKDYLYISNQKYKGSWYRELPNGSYINLDNSYAAGEVTTLKDVKIDEKITKEFNEKEEVVTKVENVTIPSLDIYNKVNITQFLSYPNFTIYCKVYQQDEKGDYNFLVTRHYEVNNVGEETDVTVSFEGEKIYRYDANGDIAIEESEKEKTIDGKITWREGAGTAFKVEWVDGYGEVIGTDTDKTQPKNSMLKDVYVDGYNVLHYMIKPKYYNYYQNNSLIMKITTIDEKVYEFPCDILFVKDGEQGTNGTTYITMIRPMILINETEYKLDTDYTVLKTANKTFKAYVYKDGKEIISGTDGYTLSFEWSGENVVCDGNTLVTSKEEVGQGKFLINQTNVIQKGNNIITVSKPNLFSNADGVLTAGAVLKVAVTISHKDLKRKIIVYYNYPISYTSNIPETLKLETNIPNFIQYESDGTTPSYRYAELYAKVNNEDKINSVTSYSSSLVNVSKVGGKYYLLLASNFLYSAGSAALKIPIDDTNYIVYTIMMYRNTYGLSEINGWDGTQMKIDEQGNYLLAAMVGAGSKDNDNKFSGMVMGELSSGEVGLFGYGKGERAFFLDANTGAAYFGKNQEITITPTDSTIAGKMKGVQKMTLKLNGSSDKDLAINVNNKFTVDYAGNMKATGANITGKITATSGSIGDWEINNDGELTNGNLVLNGNGLYRNTPGWGDAGLYFEDEGISLGGYINISYTDGGYITFGSKSTIDFSEIDVQGLNLTAVFG